MLPRLCATSRERVGLQTNYINQLATFFNVVGVDVADFELDFAHEDRVLLAGIYYRMPCQQTCASMIVCIEAVKQRNASGDIYLDKRICAMMCLCRKETLLSHL